MYTLAKMGQIFSEFKLDGKRFKWIIMQTIFCNRPKHYTQCREKGRQGKTRHRDKALYCILCNSTICEWENAISTNLVLKLSDLLPVKQLITSHLVTEGGLGPSLRQTTQCTILVSQAEKLVSVPLCWIFNYIFKHFIRYVGNKKFFEWVKVQLHHYKSCKTHTKTNKWINLFSH